MFSKKTINDIKLDNKRVIHRVAFDIPMRKEGSGWEVIDDLRLKVIFPTLFDLLEHNCQVIMLSYMGRPQKKEPSLSLKPAAERLSQLIAKRVKFVNECIGKKVEKEASSLKSGEILLLENTRFYKAEYEDDSLFAKKLASLGELFVQDAFAQCHRHHASVTGITKFLPAVAGFYLKEEVENLEKLLKRPKRPLVVVLGGAKISDKIKLLEKLIKIADFLLVAGISGDVFLKAKGYGVGRLKEDFFSPGGEWSAFGGRKPSQKTAKPRRASGGGCHIGKRGEKEDVIRIATGLLEKTEKIIVPVTRIGADNLKKPTKIKEFNFRKGEKVPEDWYLMDTGAETIKKFAPILKKAGTIFWNGPIGQTEIASFDKGTRFLLKEILESRALKFVSGGDTLRFVQEEKALSAFDHFSAGGGASLSFLAGEKLPGIEVLPEK